MIPKVPNTDSYKHKSKERLEKIFTSHLKTSFIGALSIFEDSDFGELWGHGKHLSELTQDEKEWREVWREVRSAVLDNGNNRIRIIGQELEQYTVVWNRHEYHIPVCETREEYDNLRKKMGY